MATLVSTGQITIADLHDGLHLRLSNYAHLVPSDADGSNGNFTGCATTATIAFGSQNDTSNWKITATPSAGVTGSLSGNTYTVSAMTTDVGYVDFLASKIGYAALSGRFTIAKGKRGAQGAQGAQGNQGIQGDPGKDARVNLASAEKWTYSAANVAGLAALGGDFEVNGDGNKRLWGQNPFGNPSLLWISSGNDVTSDADGGWNKSITDVDANCSYISFVYFRRNSASTNGTFYHGCDGASTLNLADGSANTNPYFFNAAISNFDLGEWYVSVGVIHGNNSTETAQSGISGVYRFVDGKKVFNGTDFKMKAGATTQSHRTYLYYSTDSTARIEWWSPGFYVVNGNEPTLQQITSMSGLRPSESSAVFTAENGWSMNRDGTFTVSAGGNLISYSSNSALIRFKKPDGSAAFAVDSSGTAVFGGSLLGATGTFSGSLAAGVIDGAAFDAIPYSYSSPGTFTLYAPAMKAGWSLLGMRITVQGAGGGGSGSWAWNGPMKAGSGGGAGQKVVYTLNSIAQGTAITVVVGTGGAGSAGVAHHTNKPASGGAGGQSKVVIGATTYAASGGAGGGFAVGGSLGGLAGDTDDTSALPGGYGGSSAYSSGGAGGTATLYYTANNGSNGGVGSGGGGGGVTYWDKVRKGGDGGNGYVLVEFFDPNTIVRKTDLQTTESTLSASIAANAITTVNKSTSGTGPFTNYRLEKPNANTITLVRVFENCNCQCDCSGRC